MCSLMRLHRRGMMPVNIYGHGFQKLLVVASRRPSLLDPRSGVLSVKLISVFDG